MNRKKSFLKLALEELEEDGQAAAAAAAAAEGTPGTGEEGAPAGEGASAGTGEGAPAGEGTGEPAPAPAEPALSEEDLAVVETEADAEAEAVAGAEEQEVALEELEAELDVATDDVAKVDAVADSLETSAENGGLTPEAANAVTIATEALLDRYDIKLAHRLPALESFTDLKTRPNRTGYAAESFADSAKELGGKVWGGILKAIQWLKDIFAKYLTAAGRLETRAKTVKEGAGRATKAKQEEVSFGGFLSKAKQLAVGGALPANLPGAVNSVVAAAFKSLTTADSASSVIEDAKKIAQGIKGASESDRDAAFSKLGDQVLKVREGFGAFFEKSATATGASSNNVSSARSAGFDLPEGSQVKATEILPGNKVIWGTRDENAGGLSRFGVAVGKQEFKAQKVKTLSVDDIKKLADSAIDASALKKELSRVEQNLGRLVGFLGGLDLGEALVDKKNAEGKDKKEGAADQPSYGELFKQFVWIWRDAVALSGAFHRPAVAVALSTASAALDLAEASLKVYEGAPAANDASKEDKPKEEPAAAAA